MLTVLHELMKKELEVTDKDLFIIIKLTVNLSCSTEKKIKKRRNWKKVSIHNVWLRIYSILQFIMNNFKN